jgi:hypothetical protein
MLTLDVFIGLRQALNPFNNFKPNSNIQN